MLLAAAEDAARGGELSKGLHWERRHAVMLSSDVMCLVDRDSGVDDLWLVGLLVNDWLNSFVHVVVDVLAGHRREGRLGHSDRLGDGGVAELGELGRHSSSSLGFIVVSEGLLNRCQYVVDVLLW